MAHWLNLGQNLKVNAKRYPDTVALKDSKRAFTYPEVNKRVNKLAHSLLSLGLAKGDKVAVLLENCIEMVEVYLATAKTGLVIVPINFRLVGPEVEYIVDNSDARAMIVHDEFTPCVDGIRQNLADIRPENYIVVGEAREMLSSIRAAPLLKGVRGEKGVDEDGIAEIILRLSQLVTDLPTIQELDLNPIVAYEDRVVVVDARIGI